MAQIFLADLPPFKVSQSQMVRINHRTILHHFLDNYRFWSKLQIFPTCVFNTSTKVFSLDVCDGNGAQNLKTLE